MSSGRVVLDIDRCKGCGLCVYVCPEKVLQIDPNAINVKGYHPATVKNIDRCVGCADCAIMCPDSVITVYGV